jgi:hypothetical protein
MTGQTDQYVTVMIETAALRVYGPDYSNGWVVKTAGDIHRCPIDEAYTLVSTGKASYPDGIGKLKEMMYQEPIAGRMEKLEADLSSSSFQALFSLTRMMEGVKKAAKTGVKVFKTIWDIKGIIAVIVSVLGAIYLMAKTHTLNWPQLLNGPVATTQAPLQRLPR